VHPTHHQKFTIFCRFAARMLKYKEVKIVILCLLTMVLVSWSKFIFTGNIKVDQTPFTNIQGWFVVLTFTISLFFFGRSYYKLYLKKEELTMSHRQVKMLGYVFILLASTMLPFLSNDIFIYLAYGDVSNHGIDVFTQASVHHSQWFYLVGNWKDAPYSYGPVTLWVAKIANWVGGNSIWGVLLAYKIIWLIIAIGFLEIISLTVKHISDFIWIVLTPVFWLQCIGNIHYDMLAGFFLLISIYFISQQKIVFSLIAIAIACMSKMVFVIFIPFIFAHYFLIGPQRIAIKPILYFLMGLLAFAGICVISYLPFWNGMDTLKVPFVFLNKVGPSKSFSEVAGEIMHALFPRFQQAGASEEVMNELNTASKHWWWILFQKIMNIFGILVGISFTIIFIIKTRLKLNKQLLAEFWVKLVMIFFFLYSHVFNVWYFIALLPFIPLLSNNDRLKKYLLIVCVYSNLHMIMNNIDRSTILYYFNLPVILFNVCLFVWQFRKNFLTIESPIGKQVLKNE
jgi:4-amino-4-deoxy-L-arabinose transferase-like glycosyltransferase